LFPKQFRIHAVLLFAALFMIFFPMLREKPDSEKAEKATAAAMVFLQLIDAEQYAESWRSAANLMKEKVTQEDWIEKLTKARVVSGALVERIEESVSYSTYAQDSPDGEYVSLTFESKFQRAENVSEFVTVMLEDGQWKAAGYFIK
jgi:translation initiation factor 2B subunit (eIF-2B alpha/beta/delta family)